MRDTITANKVVQLHYTLTLDDGDVVESTFGAQPIEYLHGHDNIVVGLEEALEGKSAGDKLEVTVPAEKGYGEHDPEAFRQVPRAQFPAELELEVGLQLNARDPQGNVIVLRVAALEGDAVTVDLNHPLAGESLRFQIEVLELRDGTEDEIAQGRPWVADEGHEHGPECCGHEH